MLYTQTGQMQDFRSLLERVRPSCTGLGWARCLPTSHRPGRAWVLLTAESPTEPCPAHPDQQRQGSPLPGCGAGRHAQPTQARSASPATFTRGGPGPTGSLGPRPGGGGRSAAAQGQGQASREQGGSSPGILLGTNRGQACATLGGRSTEPAQGRWLCTVHPRPWGGSRPREPFPTKEPRPCPDSQPLGPAGSLRGPTAGLGCLRHSGSADPWEQLPRLWVGGAGTTVTKTQ